MSIKLKPWVWDTETWKTEPSLLTPPMVCGSYAHRYTGKLVLGLHHRNPKLDDGRGGFLPKLTARLKDPATLFIGHRVCYDFAVAMNEDASLTPLIFKAYQEGRVRDTRLRQKLLDLKDGRMLSGPMGSKAYGLDNLSRIYGQRRTVKKDKSEDSVQLRYKEMHDLPLPKWPREFRKYPKEDAEGTLIVWEGQEEQAQEMGYACPDHWGAVVDEVRQTRNEFALHLSSVCGPKIDGKWLRACRKELEKEAAEAEKICVKHGLIVCKSVTRRATGEVEHFTKQDLTATRARIAAACKKTGIKPKMTDNENNPQIQYGKDAIEWAAPGDKILEALVKRNQALHYIGYLDKMEYGSEEGKHLTPGIEVLLETGRTSIFNPELQQLPKKGKIRGCIVARPGCALGVGDYSQGELVTHAQNCLDLVGESRMAEQIKAGRDLHIVTGARMLGTTYEKAKKKYEAGDKKVATARQNAKPINFGKPGGMGPAGLKEYARKAYKVIFTDEEAQEASDAWMEEYPENHSYFQMIKDGMDADDTYAVVQPISGRIRGGCWFNAAANCFFQGRLADLAKEACWEIQRRCFTKVKHEPCKGEGCKLCDDKGYSPLYGCHLILFMHDEAVTEGPRKTGYLWAPEQARVMRMVAKRWCKDVPMKVEPLLCLRYSKEAKPAFDKKGRLIPWETAA